MYGWVYVMYIYVCMYGWVYVMYIYIYVCMGGWMYVLMRNSASPLRKYFGFLKQCDCQGDSEGILITHKSLV